MIRGSKKECAMASCLNKSKGLYEIKRNGEVKISHYYWCEECLSELMLEGWSFKEIKEEEYHFCNPLCSECMQNPREAVLF